MATKSKKAKKPMADVKKSGGVKTAAPVKDDAAAKKIVVVKKGMKYRGNREAWYNLLQQMEGKTEAEFVAAATEKPPALTKAGTPEPPTGWFRFFERTGVAELR